MATSLSYQLAEQDKIAIISRFQQLHLYDDEFCKSGRELLSIVTDSLTGIGKTQKKGLKNVSLIGSLQEGCNVPRFFGINQAFPDLLNREAEMDIDYTLLEVPVCLKKHVEEDQLKRGIVRFKNKNVEFLQLARNIGWLVNDEYIQKYESLITDKNGYLKPYGVKKIAKQKLELKDIDQSIELLLAAALEEKASNISYTHPPSQVNKSAIGSNFILNVKHQPIVQISIDFATVFRLAWWPDLYAKWKFRDRKWPSPDIINDLTKQINVIAKPSDEEKDYEETNEFRYSFAHIERSLVSMRSRQQMLVYLVLKVFLVKYLKPLDSGGFMSTFLLKNTMFWVCENSPPQCPIWDTDFDSMCQAISSILKKFLNNFKNGLLPYYFDEQVNLIAGIPRDIQLKFAKKITEILSDLNKHLSLPMDKEFEAIREVLKLITSTLNVLREFERNDYSRLFRQPGLLSDVIKFYNHKFYKDNKI